MKKNIPGIWWLVTVLALSAGVTGCGDDPVDPPSVEDAGVPRPDGGDGLPDGGGGPPDGGGGLPDGGGSPPDGGSDGGTDAGPPALKASVRFVNAYLGVKNNPSDKADAPWEPYPMEVYAGNTRLFSTPVEPGDEAVTDYQTFELPPGQSVRFTVRVAASSPTDSPVAISEDISLQDGERLTLVGTGNVTYAGMDRMESPRLLALKEAFEPAEAGTLRVRYVTADRVTGTNRNRRLANDTGSTPYTTAEPYSADTTTGGVSLPAHPQRLAIIGSPNFTPSQSGKLFFSPPAETLVAGSAWFAITTGDDRRTLQDEGAPALLLIPAGRNGAIRLKRDPLIYFFHAINPATDGPAPAALQVLHGSQLIANNVRYGATPAIGELPVLPAGGTLRFTRSGDSTATVLADAPTGPLEAGRRYLAVVSGTEGAQVQLTVVKEAFDPDPVPTPRVRLIQASANAPAALGFGHFAVAPDGITPGAFTPVVTGAEYGTAAGPALGAPFTPQVVTPPSGSSYLYYGIQASVDGTVIERSVTGRPLTTPNFIVLMGDWSTSLQFRALNVRINTWSATAPEGTFSTP
ncbi:DUF4397 domain-containing protein [Stigmatella aurantiaca]|uniref:DUF4397 domain-containing protein n=1 Tax=Stigmatella aurantiaca (strain DW4/3-1) TaxID=378806 RepID=Q093C8_STIAD|nr:DUF4397 domain-containing protein [Stigmatella aurantiaca]ADO76129.1 uncharacterized protein STAUR_8375 [Stigmatella aurantiaca DW4/3-1]EAU66853.1 hypothetical protein STIAU_3035 [Stigmatella aurantiaca DW4/3-1]